MKKNVLYVAAALVFCFVFTFALSIGTLAADAQDADVVAAVSETAEESGDNGIAMKAMATAIGVGLAAAAGAIGMAMATGKAVEGIARQPEAGEKIRTSLMLGIVFIETAIIYAVIVAILIIFVL